MLYWFGVYALVVIAVLLPFLFLYMVIAISWLGLGGGSVHDPKPEECFRNPNRIFKRTLEPAPSVKPI